MGKPPKFKQVKVDASSLTSKVHTMSQNLRRGFGGWDEFKSLVEECDLKELNLRWLISISDSYLTHGTPLQRAMSGNISMFAIDAKIMDTMLLESPPAHSPKVQHLYDGVNSYDMIHCDTLSNRFYRLDSLMQLDSFLYRLWREIKRRVISQSKTYNFLDSMSVRGIYKVPIYDSWKYKNDEYEREL